MDITPDMIKSLREETGVSVMQCKKALEEANGDMEQARVALREIAKSQAEKKAERTLAGGVIASYVHSNKKMGVLLELACETDFVAQNEEFLTAANHLALHVGAMDPDSLETLLEQPFMMNPELTVRQVVEGLVQKTGERVEIGRFMRYSI